jgi:hypothetical protein
VVPQLQHLAQMDNIVLILQVLDHVLTVMLDIIDLVKQLLLLPVKQWLMFAYYVMMDNGLLLEQMHVLTVLLTLEQPAISPLQILSVKLLVVNYIVFINIL